MWHCPALQPVPAACWMKISLSQTLPDSQSLFWPQNLPAASPGSRSCKDLPWSRITQPSLQTPACAQLLPSHPGTDTKNHQSPGEMHSSKDSAPENQQRTRKLWEQGEPRERVSSSARGVGRAQRVKPGKTTGQGKRGEKPTGIPG